MTVGIIKLLAFPALCKPCVCDWEIFPSGYTCSHLPLGHLNYCTLKPIMIRNLLSYCVDGLPDGLPVELPDGVPVELPAGVPDRRSVAQTFLASWCVCPEGKTGEVCDSKLYGFISYDPIHVLL